MAPVAAAASGLVAIDQAFNEELTPTEVASTAVSIVPAGSIAKALNASESVVTMMNVDVAVVGF